MKVRLANALEMFAIRNTGDCKNRREENTHLPRGSSWFRKLRPRRNRFRLVAEFEGNVRGYLVGALTNAHGLVEDFFICTNEGMQEVSHALLEIFEVYCLQRKCQTILAPDWMDEMVIRARGFAKDGQVYVKKFAPVAELT